MTAKFSAGAIWTGQFNFNDGEVRKKYFVLLNDAGEAGHFICAVTTSQPRYLVTSSACGLQAYRLEPGDVACFDRRTWIQFDNVFYCTKEELEEHEQGGATFLQSLSEDRLLGVLTCATKSDDIRGMDISAIQSALEARRAARKAMEAAKKRTTSSTPPPAALATAASPEVLAVRAEYNKRCSNCQTNFAYVMEVEVATLQKIFSGAREPGKNFGGDASAGFELVRTDFPCAQCQRPNS